MLNFHIPSCSFIIQDPMLRGNSPVSHAGGSIGGALGHVRPAGWMSPADIVWLARPRRWCFGMALNTFSCIIIQPFNVLMVPYGDIPRRSMMYMLYHFIAMYISLLRFLHTGASIWRTGSFQKGTAACRQLNLHKAVSMC